MELQGETGKVLPSSPLPHFHSHHTLCGGRHTTITLLFTLTLPSASLRFPPLPSAPLRSHAHHAQPYTVVVDTAGRQVIDGPLMQELASIKKAVGPDETLLVVDAMTGQDSVNLAREFNDKVGITGIALTRVDGDARGGALVHGTVLRQDKKEKVGSMVCGSQNPNASVITGSDRP